MDYNKAGKVPDRCQTIRSAGSISRECSWFYRFDAKREAYMRRRINSSSSFERTNDEVSAGNADLQIKQILAYRLKRKTFTASRETVDAEIFFADELEHTNLLSLEGNAGKIFNHWLISLNNSKINYRAVSTTLSIRDVKVNEKKGVTFVQKLPVCMGLAYLSQSRMQAGLEWLESQINPLLWEFSQGEID